MNRFWDIIIEPIIKALKADYIIEVGSEKGINTKNILEYCEVHDAHMTAIDPSPHFDVYKFKNIYGDKFEFHEGLSLSILPLLEDYDVILIDGDHNWYTVYNELKIIENTFKKNKSLIIFLHDVGWPYARRDLYYNPENVPEVFRQPYKKLGIYPDQSNLKKKGGLNVGYHNSIYENNQKNGVLTAIEDFIGESDLEFTFHKVDVFNGLGILYLKDKKLENMIKDVIESADLFNKLEKERIKILIDFIESKELYGFLEKRMNELEEERGVLEGAVFDLKDRNLSLEERLDIIKEEKSKIVKNYYKTKKYNDMLDKKLQMDIKVLKEALNQQKLLFNSIKGKEKRIWDMEKEQNKLKYQIEVITNKYHEIEYLQNKDKPFFQRFVSKFPSFYMLFKWRNNGIKNALNNVRGYKSIKEHNLFDMAYYLNRNNDVKLLGMDPIVHYICYGFKEGRKPNPNFDGDYYLKKYGDVKKSNLNPLVHYALYGLNEKRRTKKEKSIETYVNSQKNDDYGVIANSGLFDSDWYIENYNHNVDFKLIDPINHYLTFGVKEKYDPNPFFSTKWYLQTNPDVVEAKINPLVHFIKHGEAEGRNPNPIFDILVRIKQSNSVSSQEINLIHDYSNEFKGGRHNSHLQFSIDDSRNKGVRTLFFSHNLYMQGAQNSLYELVIGLKHKEVVNPIVHSPIDGPLRKAYEKNGVKVIIGNSKLQEPIDLNEFNENLLSLIKKINGYNIQFVHANTLRTFYGIELARKLKISCSWNPRESEYWETYFDYLPEQVKKIAFDSFSYPYKVIFVSKYTMDNWKQLNDDNFITIYNALNTKRLIYNSVNCTREESRAILGVNGDEIAILLVGTVSERKGQKDILLAIQNLPSGVIDKIKIFIVGDKPSKYSDELHEIYAEMPSKFKQSIFIIPETSDETEFYKIVNYYLASDILVFSSRLESYPRVILEALYFNLPIITTPVFGVKEQVEDGFSALFYDPGNIKQLSDHLLKLVKDNSLRYKLRENTKKQLKQLTTHDEMLEKYGEIILNGIGE